MIKYIKISIPLITLILLLELLACGATYRPGFGKGQTFDILVYPDGIGTLLFFYRPHETKSEKIKFDVALLSDNYGEKLRIVFIDHNIKKELIYRHQVRGIPTLILFDRIGTEVYRWLPSDFDSVFSKRDMQRVIDRRLKEYN